MAAQAKRYCSYCGRVRRRCGCGAPQSAMARLMARGGRDYQPALQSCHYKRGVPPQIKRRERQKLRRHYREWQRELAAVYGGCCANCGGDEELVLDHIVPIAKGGLSEFDNLQLLCAVCNRIKGKLVWDCRAVLG